MRKNKADGEKKAPFYKKIWFWVVLCIILVMGYNGSSGSSTDNPADAAPADTAATTTTNTTSTTDSVDDSAPAGDSKDRAREIDSQLYSIALSVTTKFEGLAADMSGGNTLDAYNTAKDTEKFAQDCFGRAADQRTDASADYVQAVQNYCVEVKGVAENVIKYLDKMEMKYLSEAQEGIERVESHFIVISGERQDYLKAAGFTDDEIAEINSAWE